MPQAYICLITLCVLNHLILRITLKGRYDYHPHFTDEKTKVITVLLSNGVCVCVCVYAHTQLCLILYDPTDCNPPGSSVYGNIPGKNTGVGCHFLL